MQSPESLKPEQKTIYHLPFEICHLLFVSEARASARALLSEFMMKVPRVALPNGRATNTRLLTNDQMTNVQ